MSKPVFVVSDQVRHKPACLYSHRRWPWLEILDMVVRDIYRNDPKFSDRQVWANSVDPDQTAPSGAV